MLTQFLSENVKWKMSLERPRSRRNDDDDDDDEMDLEERWMSPPYPDRVGQIKMVRLCENSSASWVSFDKFI